MAAARDRRELGDALDETEDDRLQDAHGARVYPGGALLQGTNDALGDANAVSAARAASPSVPAAAACRSWRAVSASTSRVTGTAAVSPADASGSAIARMRRSSPTSVVYGRAPANVAHASTRSAEGMPSGTQANPTETATFPASHPTPNRAT